MRHVILFCAPQHASNLPHRSCCKPREELNAPLSVVLCAKRAVFCAIPFVLCASTFFEYFVIDLLSMGYGVRKG